MTGPPLSMLLAIAAWMLGLSLFVQVLQELYKYVTSSRSRAYSAALLDFAGPFAKQLLEPDVAPELTVRGPFQFHKLQPQGKLEPLEKDTLIGALDRTLPTWHRLTRKALEFEAALQKDKDRAGDRRGASPAFLGFLKKLAHAQGHMPGRFEAAEMKDFLEARGIRVSKKQPSVESLDATRLIAEFRLQYSPEILRVEENFAQLERNFESLYRRRNLRQTFVFAFALALWFDFSFDAIYTRATTVTPAEALAAARAATGAAAAASNATASNATASNATAPTIDIPPEALPAKISYLPSPRVRAFVRRLRGAAAGEPLRRWKPVAVLRSAAASAAGVLHYVFGCLVTAVLVCFGAPFWNDLTKSLMRVSPGEAKGKAAKETES